ncbi:ECF RNA polymerase sigma factor SigW [Allorhodopirellula heiligendammensis]|uniref:ECF RNA polymerase sigma factor SigW n=2 Tax=Allorhodopirellula heiligendammensis TaxID=2714739 RepID=A0A5C6C342_9BACT|nr:sigma-70 family RNA polymerase sigma factor [Allorhodopirellula heiligendammensis]TWU18970.1 ECF RNA polymerase sigma factor SigW [Allorhodopirellula heiligendammensis]
MTITLENKNPISAAIVPMHNVHNDGPLTVAQLVVQAQQGDREAFGELFERYRPAIVALSMQRLRNAHEAEELAQDVFIQAMQKVNQLRVPEAFGGWLRQIVHRMAINRATRGRLSVSCDPETLEATCADETSPQTAFEDRERADAVRSGLTRLGDIDQQTLRAFYLQGQSLIEMSDRFDAPVGTIKRRLHTARKRLAETMRTDFPATVPMSVAAPEIPVCQAV